MLTERLVAHRGYQALYPENTRLSLSRAIDAGALNIETDVLFSADGHPVLYHDALMQRVSGLNKAVHLLPLSDLLNCPACEPERLGDQYRGEKVARLEELGYLLSEHPDVTAFVELKRTGLHIVGAAAAFASVTGILQPVIDRVVLISFDREFIEYAHRQRFPRLGFVLDQWGDLELPTVTMVRPEFLFCNREKIPGSEDLNLPYSKLVLYEVADPEQGVALLHRGADMIETFDIGGMLKGLAHHAL